MPPLTLRSRLRRSIGPDVDGYYFVLPTVIIMVSLIVYPFCLAVWYSMSNAFIGEETHFVGLENFMYLIFRMTFFC